MLNYLSGFANHFSSEAIAGALPIGQNSPQKPPFGLYAEQFSGSAFTMPRHSNFRSWLYRINPSAKHGKFNHMSRATKWLSSPFNKMCSPNQLRWGKLLIPPEPTDFIHGLATMVGNGCTTSQAGGAIHIYMLNQSMQKSFFYNADAEMLFIPQDGGLLLWTEFGELEIKPLEIAVIPRGVKFQVKLLSDSAYGYVAENYGTPFKLPDLGPIGSNCLANPRDFLYPTAKYENISGDFELVCKFEGNFWSAKIHHSPLDVVAWHGNFAPYKYNLQRFNTIGSVSFDHPDPSIFTVLTSPSAMPGMANIDFVIFPPRWLVMENTFRPPWFHRNLMSEYMGLISGVYDAKPDGFVPGGSSLHNRMSAHGPDANSSLNAMNKELIPEFIGETMAFMLESSMPWIPTDFALNSPSLQENYINCWQDIPVLFKS